MRLHVPVRPLQQGRVAGGPSLNHQDPRRRYPAASPAPASNLSKSETAIGSTGAVQEAALAQAVAAAALPRARLTRAWAASSSCTTIANGPCWTSGRTSASTAPAAAASSRARCSRTSGRLASTPTAAHSQPRGAASPCSPAAGLPSDRPVAAADPPRRLKPSNDRRNVVPRPRRRRGRWPAPAMGARSRWTLTAGCRRQSALHQANYPLSGPTSAKACRPVELPIAARLPRLMPLARKARPPAPGRPVLARPRMASSGALSERPW